MIRVVLLAFVGSTAMVLGQEPVSGLRDRDCGEKEQLIGLLGGVEILATCSTEASNRIMHVTVKNGSAPDTGFLHGFRIGFCGSPIVEMISPPGWRSDGNGAWSFSLESAAHEGLRPTVQQSGFSIVLRPGWTQSRAMSASWSRPGVGAGGVITGTSHDCP